MSDPDRDAIPATPEISVVCPMYNEAEKIQDNIRLVRDVLDEMGRSWELILVNDGSRDDSEARAREAAGDDGKVRVVGYPTNRGRGYALRTGFAAARGEFIVATESDLSWGQEIIERMLQPLWDDAQLDMVVASPHMAGGQLVNVPAFRVFLTRFGNVLLRRLMPGGLTMNTGMTRAYRRRVLESLDLTCDRKEIHLEILSKAVAMGYRIAEVPATLAWEPQRKKRKSSFKAKKLMASHLALGIFEKPSAVLGTVSWVLMALGLVGGILAMVGVWGTGSLWAAPLLWVLLILAGTQGLMISFLANRVRDLRWEMYRMEGLILRQTRSGDEPRPPHA